MGDGALVVFAGEVFDGFEEGVEFVETFEAGFGVEDVLEIAGFFNYFFKKFAEGFVFGGVFPVGD